MTWALRRGIVLVALLTAACRGGDGGLIVTRSSPIVGRPSGQGCTPPERLAADAGDVNAMPQAEPWVAISPSGEVAVVAKDYRFGPLDDPTYNRLVWSGLYRSADEGVSWRNDAFEGVTPAEGIEARPTGAYGAVPGDPVVLSHATDPVAAFDRQGRLFTAALLYQPVGGVDTSYVLDSSALVVSRWLPGATRPERRHIIGVEADAFLFNDKEWVTVDTMPSRGDDVVVLTWRLFDDDGGEPGDGGYLAVSADGGETFSREIRLPLGFSGTDTQFFQPLIGPDPVTGHRMLYVVFTRYDDQGGMTLHVFAADIDQRFDSTEELAGRLADGAAWTRRSTTFEGMTYHNGDGAGMGFRYFSYYVPALDLEEGFLYVAFSAGSEAESDKAARVFLTRSTDGGETFAAPIRVSSREGAAELVPAVAARGGRVGVMWYEARGAEPEERFDFATIEVFFAEFSSTLGHVRTVSLTEGRQDARYPVFSVDLGFGASARPRPFLGPERLVSLRCRAAGLAGDFCIPYGFIGDYMGLAASDKGFVAAWTDLGSVDGAGALCGLYDCGGRRDQNIEVALIGGGFSRR